MEILIKTLVTFRYFRNGRPWEADLLQAPTWSQVEESIRRMDDYCFPITILSISHCTTYQDAMEDEMSLHIIGGHNRFALQQCTGPWQYEQANGSDSEAQLWQSDQGYFCQEKNIASLDVTLNLAKIFHDSADYHQLELCAAV